MGPNHGILDGWRQVPYLVSFFPRTQPRLCASLAEDSGHRVCHLSPYPLIVSSAPHPASLCPSPLGTSGQAHCPAPKTIAPLLSTLCLVFAAAYRYAHYDNSRSFSDFTPFGGWGRPAIKQYLGTQTVCGVGIDESWYTPNVPHTQAGN